MATQTNIWDTPIDAVLTNRPLIVIQTQTTVPRALKILIANNIYSAPVLDESSGEYYGFIDLVDIVTFIVQIFDETRVLGENFLTELEQEERFAMEYSSQVADLSRKNPVHPLKKGSKILEAIKIFASTGTHRIPIVYNRKIEQVLTQSAVLSWVVKHKDQLGSVLTKTVQELNLGMKHVFSVYPETKAIDALTLMAKHKVSAVAVLDHDGSLFTNISAKDLRVLANERVFRKLYSSCLEFVQAARAADMKETAAAMYCHPEDTIDKVISKLEAIGIHRLYVCDAARHPIGVITLGDVLGAILEHRNK